MVFVVNSGSIFFRGRRYYFLIVMRKFVSEKGILGQTHQRSCMVGSFCMREILGEEKRWERVGR